MRCISCGKEFYTGNGLHINEKWLGSVMCPFCCYVQDMDSDDYSLFTSERMRFENPVENKKYCIRQGLHYLIGV